MVVAVGRFLREENLTIMAIRFNTYLGGNSEGARIVATLWRPILLKSFISRILWKNLIRNRKVAWCSRGSWRTNRFKTYFWISWLTIPENFNCIRLIFNNAHKRTAMNAQPMCVHISDIYKLSFVLRLIMNLFITIIIIVQIKGVLGEIGYKF